MVIPFYPQKDKVNEKIYLHVPIQPNTHRAFFDDLILGKCIDVVNINKLDRMQFSWPSHVAWTAINIEKWFER
jgi:hypothetical protein